jgi:hypothetical protein
MFRRFERIVIPGHDQNRIYLGVNINMYQMMLSLNTKPRHLTGTDKVIHIRYLQNGKPVKQESILGTQLPYALHFPPAIESQMTRFKHFSSVGRLEIDVNNGTRFNLKLSGKIIPLIPPGLPK